ncbi:MAG: SDR family oxidoreductase [Pseudorhodoplanes sp.]
MTSRRPVTIITGASSGIGAELARVFARHGHALVLVARRADLLMALADEIERRGQTRPLVLSIDLEQAGAGDRIDEVLAKNEVEPQFVVNNAGFGLVGPVVTRERSEQLSMIDLNIRTLTDFSLRWVEPMTRHRGGLLNVASVAGFLPGPGSAVYYASKAFVVSFTEALHQEWKPRGLRITALCPGPVPTGFQARAGILNREGPVILEVAADRVAEEGYRGLMAGRRLVVPGLFNKLIVALSGIMPHRFVLAGVERHQNGRLR